MADMVKKGDVVKVTATREFMKNTHNYNGSKDAGDVGVVTGMYPWGDFDEEFNLDDEQGAPFWMKPDFVEVLTPDDADTMRMGQVWVALEDTPDFTKGKKYPVVPAKCGCCSVGLEADIVDDVLTPADNLGTFALLKDSPEPALAVATAIDRTEFGMMDDESKGLLLLDAFEGKDIQVFNPIDEVWTDGGDFFDGSFSPVGIYRTKPQELIDAEKALEESTKRTESLKATLRELEDTLQAS